MDLTPFVVGIIIFLFGTAVGSFINVLTFRLGTGLDGMRRSFCFSCGKKLNWHELIPLWSFIVQKRRCRGCKTKISWQYPIIEFISGTIFVAVFFKTYETLDTKYLIQSITAESLIILIFYVTIFSLLLALSVYDFHHKIIPNQFVYPFIALSFLNVVGIFNIEYWELIRNWELEIRNLISVGDLLAGPLLALPFAFFWFVSKGRWMGFGDAKLALGIGWLLPLSQGFATLMVAFWVGAIVSLVLLGISKVRFMRKRYTIKSEIPFGPFLAFGAFLVYFCDITFFDLQSIFIF